jgi:hypothetical protein
MRGGARAGPGPFAQEVAKGLPCALTIASDPAALRASVGNRAWRQHARLSSEDLVGVEVGGAVKNVLAIATGAADGLGLGLNARAALITRGLAEITRLGVALGGQTETFMGLTGMGDLILTCTGDLSRNRRVGLGWRRASRWSRSCRSWAMWPKACRAPRPCANWRPSSASTCRSPTPWPACCSTATSHRRWSPACRARDPRGENDSAWIPACAEWSVARRLPAQAGTDITPILRSARPWPPHPRDQRIGVLRPAASVGTSSSGLFSCRSISVHTKKLFSLMYSMCSCSGSKPFGGRCSLPSFWMSP